MNSTTTGTAFRTWPIVAAGCVGWVCMLVAATGLAQPLPAVDGHEHLGVKSCSSSTCHGSVVERNAYNVLQNEYQTWTKHDRHSRAYETLLSERSQRIATNLGLKNAHEAKVCLDCHADNVAADRRGRFFNLSDGVGCEACHGGAEDWLGIHISSKGSEADNMRAGLYPTADSGARAALCLSCHLGTGDKFASHNIMGAGHPRLTFELYTFTRRQPAHYRVDADYRRRKGVVDPAVELVEGVFVAATDYLSLLEKHYNANGPFPELAFFDCHGCHHSMDKLRWQPEPQYDEGMPGVVRLEDSRLKMAAFLAGWSGSNGIKSELAALHRASRQGRGELLAAAGRLRGGLSDVRAQVLRAAREPGASASLRQRLGSAAAAGIFNDYADAEQAAMGLQALDTRDDLDAIFDSLLDADEYEPQATAAQFARLPGIAEGRLELRQVTDPELRLVEAPPRPPTVSAPDPARVPVSQPSPTVSAPRPGPATQKPAIAVAPVPGSPQPTGTAPGSEAIQFGFVNIPVLRVRAKPSRSASVVANLVQDNRVRIYESDGDWSRISYGPGTSGWAASRFLTPETGTRPVLQRPATAGAPVSNSRQARTPSIRPGEIQMGLVNVAVLRVRSAPSQSASVIANLVQDNRVRIYEADGDWSRISYGPGTSGWVASRFLTPE